jgi:hypothetical protein
MDPKTLVSKYREYVHGNRLEMRRVVLDSNMLPSVLAAGDIQIDSSNDLLSSFVGTVRTECQIAAQNQQSVLILIFGHGAEEGYGVAVGGVSTPDKCPRLTTQTMSKAIGKAADVTLLMTSCYSGGWVIKSNRMTSKAMLNATMMTAAGPGNASESWAISGSSGRAAGSIFASALLKSAIKQQIREEGDEEEEEIMASSSYLGWAKLIYDTGRSEVDRLFHKHEIMFSAQNDAWGMEWTARSSIPWTDYKAKWEMLRTILVDTSNPLTNRAPDSNISSPRSLAKLALGESRSIHLGEGFRGSFANIVREQASQYLNSFPGNPAVGGNTLYHSSFHSLVRGEDFDNEELEELSDVLSYRAAIMGWATDCKNYLDLTIDDAHLFDTWGWEQLLNEEKWNIYKNIRNAVFESRIIGPPAPGQGLSYAKAVDYLAIAFYESNRPKAQVMAELGKLLKSKLFLSSRMYDV